MNRAAAGRFPLRQPTPLRPFGICSAAIILVSGNIDVAGTRGRTGLTVSGVARKRVALTDNTYVRKQMQNTPVYELAVMHLEANGQNFNIQPRYGIAIA